MPKTAAALALALATSAAGAPTSLPPPLKPVPDARSPAPAVPPPGAAGRPAPKEPQPSGAPVPRGAVLEEVSGTVRRIDRKAYELTVEAVAGPVKLSLDRNTMVYTANGLGTVLDLAPGQQIRAGRNADYLAYWVQVRSPTRAEPVPAPGQGTGPAGAGAAPAGEATGPGTGPAPSPPASAPGGAAPGPAPAGTPPKGR